MFEVYSTVKERLSRYLLANAKLKQDAFAGDDIIYLEDNFLDFSEQAFNSISPHLLIQNINSTGERSGDGGFIGAEYTSILKIDSSIGKIWLNAPLQNNWLVSDESYILRCPGGLPIADVRIGDLKVVTKYPTVCVAPTNKTLSWNTFNTTKENITIDLIVYVQGGDTEQGNIDLMKIVDVIVEMCMSNLHLKVEGATKQFQVTSAAMVKNVDYGTISKGNEFLKGGKITWEGEVCVSRLNLVGREPYERKNSIL